MGLAAGPIVDRPRHFLYRLVQDYTSIILGVREEGQSFGALSYRLISPRSRKHLDHLHLLLPAAYHGGIGTQSALGC